MITVHGSQPAGGIDLIEQVQRRFTKHLRCLDGVAYTDRLQRLNLPSLELRRLHLDLVFWLQDSVWYSSYQF